MCPFIKLKKKSLLFASIFGFGLGGEVILTCSHSFRKFNKNLKVQDNISISGNEPHSTPSAADTSGHQTKQIKTPGHRIKILVELLF